MKASKINLHHSKSGGGLAISEFLTPTEKLVIITPMAVAGEDQIEESVIVVGDVVVPSREKEDVCKTSECISNRYIKLSLFSI